LNKKLILMFLTQKYEFLLFNSLNIKTHTVKLVTI